MTADKPPGVLFPPTTCGETAAASENGEASFSSSGVVAAETARGEETFGLACESEETGNLPLGFGFVVPPRVRRVGLP